MDMINPEHSERNDPERPVARGALVVAGGQAPELLAPTDEVLHFVPQTVQRPIKRPGPVLVRLARNGGADPSPAAALANGLAAIALVPGHPVGAQARSAPPWALDRPLGQELREHRRLVGLARG